MATGPVATSPTFGSVTSLRSVTRRLISPSSNSALSSTASSWSAGRPPSTCMSPRHTATTYSTPSSANGVSVTALAGQAESAAPWSRDRVAPPGAGTARARTGARAVPYARDISAIRPASEIGISQPSPSRSHRSFPVAHHRRRRTTGTPYRAAASSRERVGSGFWHDALTTRTVEASSPKEPRLVADRSTMSPLCRDAHQAARDSSLA